MKVTKFRNGLPTPHSGSLRRSTFACGSKFTRLRRVLLEDVGAATAEYAIATMAAVGLAGVLVGILKGNVVQQLLTNLITGALTLGG